MEKINFISRWTPNKEQTWSGINWGLFNSLSKYFDLEDVDISVVKPSIISKAKSFISSRTPLHINDLGLNVIEKTRKYTCNRQLESNIYFQFDESVLDSEHVKTYIFIDESVDHVLYMKQNYPEMFNLSNYAFASESAIARRCSSQNEYFQNCAGIFTLCHWLVDDLVNRTGIPAKKVHYGGSGINVDIDSIDYSKKQGNKLLFVGKDFERKGGFHVVNSFKKLKERMPEAQLYIAGPVENPIKEEIQGVHFMGRCNRQQLNKLYNLCDVFVMPSYFEAFGIVFVEALTFGLPCLVRNCQDMPYIVEDGITGAVISEDNDENTATKMYELLTDKKYVINVRNKKDFYQQYYSWDTVAKRIFEVISTK